MTIHTPVTIVNGLQSSNTMIKKQSIEERSAIYQRSSAKNKGTEKREAARRELTALSRHLKGQRDLRIAAATSEDDAIALSLMTVNDLLIEHYLKKSGATEFRKFKDWKTLAYQVKKGETAFRVWAAPTRAAKQGEVIRKDGTREDAESHYEFYPMCCLFSDLQVQAIEDTDELAPCTETNEAIH